MLSVIKNGKWHPGIGDPTIIGWLIVAAYITAALLSIACAVNSKKDPQKEKQVFWIVTAIIMALLAVNKQLDFQTYLLAVARNAARHQGWYRQRHIFQAIVLVVMAVAGIAAISFAIRHLRNIRGQRLAFCGLVLLLVFIVIRGASSHFVDNLLAFKIIGLKLRYALELAAITLITASSAAFLLSRSTGTRKGQNGYP